MSSPQDSTSVPASVHSEAGTSVPSPPQPPPSASRFSWKKLGSTAWPLAIAGGIVLFTNIPLCPTKFAFGIPCPGCGLTRATVALLHLDLHGMLHFHPLAPILTPIVVWWIAAAALGSAGLESARKWDPGKIFPRAFWITLGVALIALYVARVGGLLGGLPDAIDPSTGALGRIALAISALFSG